MNSLRATWPCLAARLLLAVLAWPMAAIANPCSDDPGGIGGTGVAPQSANADDPGGIGGTGVVGTITGFGSICVNGIEVHFDYRTQIDRRGFSLRRSFDIGQVVAVRAEGSGDELDATHIVPLDPIAGPVTSIDATGRDVTIMGRPVDIGDARFTGSPKQAGNDKPLRVGEFVRVSGLARVDSSIHATLLTREGPTDQAEVLGMLTSDGNVTAISGVPVKLPDGVRIVPGREVRARGVWSGDRLAVRKIEVDPLRRLISGLPRLELQGFWNPGKGSTFWGLPVRVDARTSYGGNLDARLADEARVRVRIRATPDTQWIAERIVFESAPSLPGLPGVPRAGARNADRDPATASDNEPEDAGRSQAPGNRDSRDGKPGKDREDNPGPPDRPSRTEKTEKPERPPRIERPDKPMKPERPELPDRPGKPEKPQKPERR